MNEIFILQLANRAIKDNSILEKLPNEVRLLVEKKIQEINDWNICYK